MGPILQWTAGPVIGPGFGPGSGPVGHLSALTNMDRNVLRCIDLRTLGPAAPSLATDAYCQSENHPLWRGERGATPVTGVALTRPRAGAGSASRGRSPLAPALDCVLVTARAASSEMRFEPRRVVNTSRTGKEHADADHQSSHEPREDSAPHLLQEPNRDTLLLYARFTRAQGLTAVPSVADFAGVC